MGPEQTGLQMLVGRPLGLHADLLAVPGNDPGMVHLHRDGTGSCSRCGWTGAPTSLRGDSVFECPRCQAAVEVDELGAGIDARLCPRTPNRPCNVRKQMRGASGEAWRRRGVGGRRVVSEPPRNAPCPCGSGAKYKKCCGR